MPDIAPLKPHLRKYLIRFGLLKKWEKTKEMLEKDLSYPSLCFKKIVLEHTDFYSFRLDKQYRGICYYQNNKIHVVMFTNHYHK